MSIYDIGRRTTLYGTADTVVASEERRAARAHDCDVCGGTIRKGTRYVRGLVRRRDDGRHVTFHSHADPRYHCQEP